MSRCPRRLSESGMYHIMFRGISRQNIFEDNRDFKKMLEILKRVKSETGYELYAYCFMNNHVHLFIKEKEVGQISRIMSKILSHYALWFNKKYDRVGVLFENRYKSEPVEDERYYLGLVRYIHQNPLKAGMVENLEKYKWSSYNDYVKNANEFVDIDMCLEMLSANRKKAIRDFKEFNYILADESYAISSSNRKTAAQVKRIIEKELNGKAPDTMKAMPKEERNRLLKKLVLEKHISKSALERATGISRGTIIRIVNN